MGSPKISTIVMVKYGEKGVKTMVEYGEIWRFVS